MLRMPRAVDRKAREVGTQEWKTEENLARYRLVGVQCSGRLTQIPSGYDRDIVGSDAPKEEESDDSKPSICYLINDRKLLKAFCSKLVMWSDR